MINILSFDGNDTFLPTWSTRYIHDGVEMAKYKNQPIIVGDYKHNEMEFMHLSYKRWYTANPYPIEKVYFGYATVSQSDKVFFLGGSGESSERVSVYENESFGPFGSLRRGRINHVAIPFGDNVLIIGGKLSNSNQA